MFVTVPSFAALALAVFTAACDRVAPPPPRRVFASADGTCVVRVEKVRGAAPQVTCAAVTLNRKGVEVPVWKRELEYTPWRVFVASDGHAVAVDSWGRRGNEHTVVVIDAKGKIVRDYQLEDILTKAEIGEHVLCSVSNRWWTQGAWMRFESPSREETIFAVDLPWGKKIRISSKTGRILRTSEIGQ